MKWLLFLILPINFCFAQEIEPSNNLFQGTSTYLSYGGGQGNVLMGDNKISAEFYIVSLGLKKNLFYPNLALGLEFNILRNQSPLNLENLLLSVNYDYPLKYNLIAYGQFKYGLGFMRESSAVHKIESSNGSVWALELGARYPLQDLISVPLDVGLGLWWLNQSHKSGSASEDLIVDQKGLKLLLQYNF